MIIFKPEAQAMASLAGDGSAIEMIFLFIRVTAFNLNAHVGTDIKVEL